MARRVAEEIKQTRPFASPKEELHVTLGRTWAVLEHAFSDMLKPYGITATQYNVLRILRGACVEAGLCRGEVMERMIAKVPDATRLLDRMESAGLIVRQRETADRRFVTTRISEEGSRLLNELHEPVQELHQRHFGVLDDEEQHLLIDLLDRIRAAV